MRRPEADVGAARAATAPLEGQGARAAAPAPSPARRRSAEHSVERGPAHDDRRGQDEETNRSCSRNLLVIQDTPAPADYEAALSQRVADRLPKVDSGKHGIEVAHAPEETGKEARQGSDTEVEFGPSPRCQCPAEVENEEHRRDHQDPRSQGREEGQWRQEVPGVGLDANGLAALIEAPHGHHQAAVGDAHSRAAEETEEDASCSGPLVIVLAGGAVLLLRQALRARQLQRRTHADFPGSLLPLVAEVTAAGHHADACYQHDQCRDCTSNVRDWVPEGRCAPQEGGADREAYPDCGANSIPHDLDGMEGADLGRDP
mmetsp:Transcript_45662/g.130330  ORF Transcript_45662/g.130330 Transcript_45662/m.130330 type:complete len:316 (-) Transcript_45662:402-1349(-)